MAEIPEQTASRRDAVQKVRGAQSFSVTLPVIGRVPLPRPEQLAFYGALGVLAAAEIIEWPVALVIGAGHFLVQEDHNPVVREVAEAMEDV